MRVPEYRRSAAPLRWLYPLALFVIAWGPANADLPFAPVNNPIASMSATSKYQDRFVEAWTTSLDTSALTEMFQDQQRWRRSQSRRSQSSALAAYDCSPSYHLSASDTAWFQRYWTEMGVCFTLCIDYPACTSTAPIIIRSAEETGTGKPQYQLLVRCGLLAAWNDTTSTGHPAEIQARGPDGSPRAICRNVVDTFAAKPGVMVRSVVPPPTPKLASYIKLQAFTRDVEREYDDELVISGHDLFSHLLYQPITFRQWPNSSSSSGGTDAPLQALMVPTGSEYSNLYKRYDLKAVHERLKQGSSLAQLWGAGHFQRLITGAWVVSPDARGAIQATYIVQKPDLAGRWVSFTTWSQGSTTIDAWSNFARVQVPCRAVVERMFAAAAAWNTSSLALQTPKNCTMVENLPREVVASEASMLKHLGFPMGNAADRSPWVGAATRVVDAASRLALAQSQRPLCPVLLDQDLGAVNMSDPEEAALWQISGCDASTELPLIVYDRWTSQPRCTSRWLSTTPAAETHLQAGYLLDTYRGVWDAYTWTQNMPAEVKIATRVDADLEGGPWLEGYYTAVDAALLHNVSEIDRIVQQALAQAVNIMNSKAPFIDPNVQQAVINSFVSVFLVWVGLHRGGWGGVTRRLCMWLFLRVSMPGLPGRRQAQRYMVWGPDAAATLSPCRRWVVAFYLTFWRLISMASGCGMVLFGFYAAVNRDTGRRLSADYPNLVYYQVMGSPACSGARHGNVAVGVSMAMVQEVQVAWPSVYIMMGVVIGSVLVTCLWYLVHVRWQRDPAKLPPLDPDQKVIYDKLWAAKMMQQQGGKQEQKGEEDEQQLVAYEEERLLPPQPSSSAPLAPTANGGVPVTGRA